MATPEFGTEQNDIMVAARQGALMYGLGGNDTMLGSLGFDILSGGAGNDILLGGDCEQDRYVFQAGHGQDEVRDLGLANRSEHTNEIVFEVLKQTMPNSRAAAIIWLFGHTTALKTKLIYPISLTVITALAVENHRVVYSNFREIL